MFEDWSDRKQVKNYVGLLQTTDSYEHSVSQSSIRLMGGNEYIFGARGGGSYQQS